MSNEWGDDAPAEQELKQSFKATLAAFEQLVESRTCLVREAIIKAQNRHGGLRAAARALKIDVGYLLCLKTGKKTNPSDAVLRKLKLK